MGQMGQMASGRALRAVPSEQPQPPPSRLLGQKPAAPGSISLGLTVGRLQPTSPWEAVPMPAQAAVCLSSWSPSQVLLLLLGWRGLPVDQDESAEDE